MDKIVNLIFQRNIAELEKEIDNGTYDVNSFISLDRSGLSLAAACNYIDVMELLIKKGADVNLNNSGDLGYTPLEEAAREGKTEAIEFLLENGAEIDKGNTINTNALIGACIGAHGNAIKLLLEKGANVNHQDSNGQTALHYLCRYAKQWGGGIITQTVNGVTTEIENTRFKEHQSVFKVLLESGADVNLETNYGYTPVILAAESNASSFIEPLAKAGADINWKNSKGFTAIHAASDRGNFESCQELIAQGANINAIDGDGFTPLLGAVSSQNKDLVKLFVDKGASKEGTAKISYGKVQAGDDVMTLAKRLDNSDILTLLN
ncbi:MAG: ankyrin repeat domain-containing protein [Flavobacteriales bacterium]|nr:ankyrin repeat domain-containing protein [Flavobacteriales bacterium]